MTKWEVLPGLPPYGPPALNFSATGHGTHTEGYVVRFESENGESWVGNFKSRFLSFCNVSQHPDGEKVVVVAGGTAYVISPRTRECLQTFGAQIEWTGWLLTEGLLLFASLTDVLALDKDGIRWRSRRISWDGLRKLSVVGVWLTGEAYTPLEDEWRPFRLNALNGVVEGGTYSEPE